VRCCVALVGILVACGNRETPETNGRKPTMAEKAPGEPKPGCEQVPFAASTPVPEASGAAWLMIDGALMLVVVADSGHDGAYGLLDPETGETKRQGELPLGKGASDDIEGLAARGDKLYGLTSAGSMRVWTWNGTGFDLVDGPYPVGTGDEVCAPMKSNCGLDYEGLAIAPTAPSDPGACAGFACARGDGSLYCLVEDGGKLHIDRARRIPVESKKMSLSDCAFSESGTLLTGNNLLGLASIHRIDGWSDPATAKVVEQETLGTGFPEVIALRGDTVYRMSDMGGDGPSLLAKFRCTPQGR
jgi:hypothetical protein